MAKLRYKSFVTSLERADKKTGWVGKKLIVDLPISVTKWVWMVLVLNYSQESNNRSIMSLDLLIRTHTTLLDSLKEITNKRAFSVKNYEIRGFYS